MQPSTLRDYDERDMFCLFLLPGNKQIRKVVLSTWLLSCFLDYMPVWKSHDA